MACTETAPTPTSVHDTADAALLACGLPVRRRDGEVCPEVGSLRLVAGGTADDGDTCYGVRWGGTGSRGGVPLFGVWLRPDGSTRLCMADEDGDRWPSDAEGVEATLGLPEGSVTGMAAEVLLERMKRVARRHVRMHAR